MILHARVVVTMDGPPIINGGVAIKGNQIVDVGGFDDIKTRRSDQVIDLGDVALLPGLINAHCHLDYTSLRSRISPSGSFTDWIRLINAQKARLSEQDYITSIAEGLAEAARFGTTSIANLTAFPQLIATTQTSLRLWWFAEVMDVRGKDSAANIIQAALGALGAARNRSGGVGLAPHAPYTASQSVFRLAQEESSKTPLRLTTHLAESREEMEMFRDAKGPLYDFLKEMGRDMSDCGGPTPLRHFFNTVSSIEGWIIVHLNELTDSDFDFLERSKARFNVVHSARSHNYFGHSAFPFQELRSLGFNICLGTDSLASNDDLSLFAEMRAFQEREPGISPEEILSMVTANGARALGEPHSLGKLRAGYRADMVAVPFRGSRKNLFEAILAFDSSVVFSMIAGKIVTG
jgi:aminodeoxyfutalosine deaminase